MHGWLRRRSRSAGNTSKGYEMSHRENLARYHGEAASIGLTYADADQLRKDAQRLHTWNEHECNGVICRAESGMTDRRGRALTEGATYWVSNINGPGPLHYSRTPDRESGCLRRIRELAATIGATFECQGDPRGWPVTLRLPDGRTLSPPIR